MTGCVLKQSGIEKAISVGPWGGQDGITFDDGVYSTVRQVVITHGAGVDSVQIEYEKQGVSVWSNKHGGHGGLKTDTVSSSLCFVTKKLTCKDGTHHGYQHFFFF